MFTKQFLQDGFRARSSCVDRGPAPKPSLGSKEDIHVSSGNERQCIERLAVYLCIDRGGESGSAEEADPVDSVPFVGGE